MNEFTRRTRHNISAIPKGCVATYGQIAAMAGNAKGARTVVWVLNSTPSKEGLPWHRVINSRGRISLKGEGGALQKKLLECEGVVIDSCGHIDLMVFGWHPEIGNDII